MSFGHARVAVRLEGQREAGEALGILPFGVEGVGDAAGGRQVRVALRERVKWEIKWLSKKRHTTTYCKCQCEDFENLQPNQRVANTQNEVSAQNNWPGSTPQSLTIVSILYTENSSAI